MSRMNWGGAQDLSGVFSALQGRYEADVEADVANARARAAEEQAAEDREMHAKWMAGKISDAEWLAHLEGRVTEALDPEERSQYTEMLLEHRGAIQDAQMEARFAMGQVSLGSLMKHYSKRMAGVDKNSPAWRELAMRYGQLSGAVGGGGGGGGGRGGRRGGGSGSGDSDYDPAAVVGAGIELLEQGDMFKGIHTSGPDLIDPTLSMRPIEDDDDLIDSLRTDIERIEQLEEWMDSHPGDRTVIDEATGEEFEVTNDFLINLDKQYLRTQQALAAAYYARGTAEDDMKGTQALGYATNWVAGPMTRHNTMRVEPQMQMLEQFVFSEVVGASNITDPEERRRAYGRALAHVKKFARENGLRDVGDSAPVRDNPELTAAHRGNLPTATPDALRADEDIFTRVQVLEGVLEVGAHSDRYSMDELNAMADRVLGLSSTIGEGGASISIETLLTGPGEDERAGNVPDGFIGLLETMTQIQGLEQGRRILAGVPDPEYDGPVYVYAYDGEKTRAVIADVRDQPTAAGGVVPVLVPQGEDPDALVLTRVRIGGKVQSVWVAPQPVDDPRYRVYRRSNGELLTSDEIKDMGTTRLRALVGNGDLTVDSVLTGVRMPDGRVWFRDNDTGMFHLQPPVVVETDATTGGVLVDEEGEAVLNHLPFAPGVMTPFAGVSTSDMQRWTEEAISTGLLNPRAFRQRGAGGDLVDLESVEGMYQAPAQSRPKSAPLLMGDQLEIRRTVGEREFQRAGGDAVVAAREHEEQQQIESTRRAAEKFGLQVGGFLTPRGNPVARNQPAQPDRDPDRGIWPAGERYVNAIQSAMTAISARDAEAKRVFDLLTLRRPKTPPAGVRPPAALLPGDRPNLAPPRRVPAPLPQYNPNVAGSSPTPVKKGGKKSGGAKLV
jgi:hypothetical protein